tara:strand:- start:283 stop:954 length:672 start_codon:yes stop_codon:yes gene_type:complete
MNINKIQKEARQRSEKTKPKRLAKQKITLRKKKEAELEQDVLDLQGVGLLQNVDKDKPATEILDDIRAGEEEDTILYENNTPLVKMTRRGYKLDDKILAIMFMEAFQQEHKGEMKPKFAMIGRWFGYNRNNMMSWWEKRNEILKQKSAITDQAMNVIQLRLTTELLRMTDTLSRKDYDSMADKDFISLLNTIINKVRLMTNLSTQNVEHKHGGGVNLVMPKET